MKTLGERIADLRRERGITQENLAGIIGVSAQAISKWENNATMPDIMLLPIIADTLGVTIDELFGIRHKVQEKPINCEETPVAVYDQILNTMWRSGDNNDFAERAKAQFAKNPYQHSGFVSEVAGAVYANKDIALTYLPSDKESLKLLENEEAAGIKPNVRFYTKDDYAVIAMVEQGLGISIMPELLLKGRHDELQVMPLIPEAKRTIGIAIAAGDKAGPATRRFVDYVVKYVSEIK